MNPTFGRGLIVTAAASLLAMVLGSVHGFSVFLEPLSDEFGASRSSVSLTYSIALVTLSFAVLTGPRLFGRWSAATFVLLISGLGTLGALIAGTASSLWLIWLGYSLLFGFANGLGYGFGLQISAKYNSGQEGLVMGIVTAAYGVGAVISPFLFSYAVDVGGFRAAMQLE